MSDQISDNIATGTSYSGETPPLDQLIQNAIDFNLKEVHTWLPAKIVEIKSPSRVSIQLELQRVYSNGVPISIPIIQDIPVGYLSGSDYWIKPPLALGDEGVALFCERSLDIWLISGGVVDPKDTRSHSYSDPVFYPGLRPFSNPVPAGTSVTAATDMVLHNGSAEIYIQKAGTFLFTNGTNEIVSLLNQILTKTIAISNDLATATTNTMLGPQPLNNATAFSTLATQLAAIQTKLATLVGS